jgi:hypothetical protein
MELRLHKNARTTPAVRAEIAASTEGMIRRAASIRVSLLQGADVQTLNDFDNQPGQVVFR